MAFIVLPFFLASSVNHKIKVKGLSACNGQQASSTQLIRQK